MKKIVKLLLCVLLLSCLLLSTAYGASKISVIIDGKMVEFTDAEPFIDENGRTQAPLRAIAEALGCSVGWDGTSQTATIKKDYTEASTIDAWIYDIEEGVVTSLYEYSRELELKIGSNKKITNYYNSLFGEQKLFSGGNSEQEMDTTPIIKNDRTYLPVRHLAEAFGYNVSWDGAIQCINIVSQNTIEGRFNSDVVSTFSDLCGIALYENEFTKDKIDFVNIENVMIKFKDNRTVDVTGSFLNATDELQAVYTDFGGDYSYINIEYAGKVEYDFNPAENKVFQLIVKTSISDRVGNVGYHTYVFNIDITEGEGGYL